MRMAPSAARAPWIGVARIEAGWGAFVGALGDNAMHRHHAIQVMAGEGIRLTLSEGDSLVGPGFVVPAGMLHQAESAETSALLYIDPDNARARSVFRGGAAEFLALGSASAAEVRETIEAAVSADDWDGPTLQNALGAGLSSRDTLIEPLDERVRQAIALMDGAPEIYPGASALAAKLNMSTSRLVHLFSQQTGLPLRAYMKWLRLRRALRLVAGGANLTDAAHGAGFSDSAHLSRTCRATFGVSPLALTKGLSFRVPGT